MDATMLAFGTLPDKCPKCDWGGLLADNGPWKPPVYRPAAILGYLCGQSLLTPECLQYECHNCGYEMRTAPKTPENP